MKQGITLMTACLVVTALLVTSCHRAPLSFPFADESCETNEVEQVYRVWFVKVREYYTSLTEKAPTDETMNSLMRSLMASYAEIPFEHVTREFFTTLETNPARFRRKYSIATGSKGDMHVLHVCEKSGDYWISRGSDDSVKTGMHLGLFREGKYAAQLIVTHAETDRSRVRTLFWNEDVEQAVLNTDLVNGLVPDEHVPLRLRYYSDPRIIQKQTDWYFESFYQNSLSTMKKKEIMEAIDGDIINIHKIVVDRWLKESKEEEEGERESKPKKQ